MKKIYVKKLTKNSKLATPTQREKNTCIYQCTIYLLSYDMDVFFKGTQ